MTAIRVAVVDDDAAARRGLRMMLEAEPDISVVGEGSDGHEGVELVRAMDPDVLVTDLAMEPVGGLEATRRLVADGADTRVLLVTILSDESYVYEALRAGASGFLLKDSAPELLATAVRVLAAGDALVDPAMTRWLIGYFATRVPGGSSPRPGVQGLEVLTPRERGVLEQVAMGLSNAEIALRLVVSESTVKSHVSSLLSKLDLRDRVQAVIFAYEQGVIVPGRGAVSGSTSP